MHSFFFYNKTYFIQALLEIVEHNRGSKCNGTIQGLVMEQHIDRRVENCPPQL